MHKLSDKSFKKIRFAGQGKSNKKRNFQEWFDDDCRKAKKGSKWEKEILSTSLER